MREYRLHIAEYNIIVIDDVILDNEHLYFLKIAYYLKQQTELLGVVNKGAGLTGKFSEDVREELTQANIPLTRLGIGFAGPSNHPAWWPWH